MRPLRKISETLAQTGSLTRIGMQMSKAQAANLVVTRYDVYRRVTGAVLFVLVFVFAFTGRWGLAGWCALGFHLQALTNQLWWKLRSIEHQLDERGVIEEHDPEASSDAPR